MSKTAKTTRTGRKTSSSTTTRSINVDRAVVNNIKQQVIDLLNSTKNGQWIGTMTDLSGKIRTGIRSPSYFRRVLNVIVPSIRNAGVSVRFGRTTDHSRTRYVRFIAG
jgi:hypothetical protein